MSVAEAATIPRDLWLDLVRISEAAGLAGMDQNMDTTCKQKQPHAQAGSQYWFCSGDDGWLNNDHNDDTLAQSKEQKQLFSGNE